MIPEIYQNYVGSKVAFTLVTGHNKLTGIVRGIYYESRRGGGLWNWTLQIQILTCVGMNANSYTKGMLCEKCLADVIIIE